MIRYVTAAIYFTAFFLISGSALAKNINEGAIEFSGDTSFESASSEFTGKVSGTTVLDVEEESRDITVGMLYYVAPNVGVGLLWNNEYTETDDGVDKDEETFGMMGILGGYNISLDAASSVRLIGALIFSATLESKTNGVTDIDADGDGIMFGVHYKRFFNEYVSLNFGFTSVSAELDDSPATLEIKSSGFNIGFSVHLD